MAAHAQLILGKTKTTVPAVIPFLIVNRGDTDLLYGAEYRVQRLGRNGWKPVPGTSGAFAAWSAAVEAGQTSSHRTAIDLPASVRPGNYRVVVEPIVLDASGRPSQDAEGRPQRLELVAELEVTSGSTRRTA